MTDAPPDWSVEIIQGYFVWAKHVIAGLKGINEPLEKALEGVFTNTFKREGKDYPVLPAGPLDQALQNYYKALQEQEDKKSAK